MSFPVIPPRDGIVPGAAPGMTTANAPDREPTTPEAAMLAERASCILGTGRLEAAMHAEER